MRDQQTCKAVSHQDDWAVDLADLGSEFRNPDSTIGVFPVRVLELVKASFFLLPDCLPMIWPGVKKAGKNKIRDSQVQGCEPDIWGLTLWPAGMRKEADPTDALSRESGPTDSTVGPELNLA